MSEEKKPSKPAIRLFSTKRLRNWLSFAGMVLAGSALGAFALLFVMDLISTHGNPYTGILAYVVAPGFLLLGLAMTLLGYLLESRRLKKNGHEPKVRFVWHVDLSRKRDRKLLVLFLSASAFFLFLTAFGSYETYHLMETNAFCGEVCHTPMEAQYEAYKHAAHARVDCVSCHIGPGTEAYLKTKLNGVKQMYHAIKGDFPRPIKIKSRDLRLTEQTCKGCHWSQKHYGDRAKSYRHFLADETNSPFTVNMVLKLGGGDPAYGPVQGVHAHMDPSRKIEYIPTDESLLEIPWVRVTDENGKVTEYRAEGFNGNVSEDEVRTMGCIDCHNRPAHRFVSPNEAVDQSLAMGRIDPSMPWAKAKAVEALVRSYTTREEAQKQIESYLRQEYADDERVDQLIDETLDIYAENFFPEMKADWRAYPEFIGHKDTKGCLRCHDGMHVTPDKRPIKSSGCNDCHIITSQGSGKTLQDIKPKGHEAFIHMDFEYTDPDCADCHTGQTQKE